MSVLLAGVWACGQTSGTPAGTPEPAAPPAAPIEETNGQSQGRAGDQADPSELPTGGPERTLTPEECEALGGTVKPSPGNQVFCDEGQETLGGVATGIEGGVCCK